MPYGYKHNAHSSAAAEDPLCQGQQGKEVRFYSLYDKVWREDVLWEAWQQVKANKGAPGVDGQSIEAIV